MARFQTREELSERLTAIFGDRTDDDALNFIQDSLETFDHHMAVPEGGISNDEHQRLMTEQDTAWRKRYRDAFLSGKPDAEITAHKDKSREDPVGEPPGSSADNPASFDDILFKGE